MYRNLILTVLAVLMVGPDAYADRRKYVWTYQYATLAPDEVELEFYQTTKLSSIDSWEYRIEIEHGLTPNWDMSIYQIFAQKEGESLAWDAFQVRTRYRLAQPGRFFMDPLVYLEYRRKLDLEKQNKLEGKLILSRRMDRIDLSVNPVYEFFWGPGDVIHEIGLDLGISYEFSYRFSLGLESTSRLEFLKDQPDEKGSYFGPTVSVASGGVFYTVGYAWGLSDDSDDARVRFLMGIDL